MTKPIAVIISDLHFTVPTLELATKALLQAINKAIDLQVPLVIAGDTLDSKAIMRAECVNRLIEIGWSKGDSLDIFLMAGNHDLVNEKSNHHCLNFLSPSMVVVGTPRRIDDEITLIPYQSDKFKFLSILEGVPKHHILVIHQGVQGAKMGHYTLDNSSLPLETFKGRTVISGHYHQAQTLNIPGGGSFTYVGNPYTLTFGEANDPAKGFLVLYDDGSFVRIPTNLRRHRIVEMFVSDDISGLKLNKEDLLWFKIKGSALELKKVNKKMLDYLVGNSNYKLDLIPTDEVEQPETTKLDATPGELFDQLLDAQHQSEDEKQVLKDLWKEIYEAG